MACGVCMGINSDRCPVCGKETRYTTCPECNGRGYTQWYAINLRTGDEEEVTEETWICLPPNERTAYEKGWKFYRGYREECSLCGGTGEVEYDPAFDAYEDPDEYHERRLEEMYG